MRLDDKGFERIAGLTIAIAAALLAISDLLGDKYGDDEILGTNEKSNAYAWYQAKSMKQSLVEHQIELVELIPAVEEAARQAELTRLKAEDDRYEREKKEILEGSDAVGPDGWALKDDNGEKGHIHGANPWTTHLARLETAGDHFDLGSLFLQLALVLGAVSLVADERRLKGRYYWAMVLASIAGTALSAWGLATALG